MADQTLSEYLAATPAGNAPAAEAAPRQSVAEFLSVSETGQTPAAAPQTAPPARALRPSDFLTHPDVADRETTARARAFAEAATRPDGPTMSAYHPSLVERLIAPIREGAIGRAIHADTASVPERMQDRSQPLIRMEAAAPDSGPGIVRGAAEFGSGLTTPENLLLMAYSGGLGKVSSVLGKGLVSRLASAGFTEEMLRGAYGQVPQLREAWNKSDWPMVRQTLTKMALGVGTAGLTARHALKGGGGAAEEKGPGEKAPEAKAPERQYTITGRPVRQSLEEFLEEGKDEAKNSEPQGAGPQAARAAGGAQPGGRGAGAAEQPATAGTAKGGVNGTSDGGDRGSGPGAARGGSAVGDAQAVPKGNQPGVVRQSTAGRGGLGGGQPEPDAGGGGADHGSVRRVTGSADVPLVEEGRRQAREMAGRVPADIQVYHAPNDRSAETGKTVSARAQPADWLEPWKLGAHEGKPLESEREPINARIVNRPDEAPGVSPTSGEAGESFNAFRKRIVGGILEQRKGMDPGAKTLNITSGRALQIVDAWAKAGGKPNASVDAAEITAEKGEFSKPGQLFRLGGAGLEPVERVEGPGQYFAQHGATEWNKTGGERNSAPQPLSEGGGRERPAAPEAERGARAPSADAAHRDGEPAEPAVSSQSPQAAQPPSRAPFSQYRMSPELEWLHNSPVRLRGFAVSPHAQVKIYLERLREAVSHLAPEQLHHVDDAINEFHLDYPGLAGHAERMAEEGLQASHIAEAEATMATREDVADLALDEATTAFNNAQAAAALQPPKASPADDGVYLGSGLGSLEPLFRESKADGDAMRLKRNAAMQAVQKARESPEEHKAGESLRNYFTAERDLWAVRVNQALDIVTRKVLPKRQDREAVAIMREFRHKPEELAQFIDGSHPFLQEVNGGEAAGVKNLDRLRPVMRQALRMIDKPTDREAKADRLYTNIAEKSLEEGRKGGWLESRWQPDEYLPHLLNAKGEGEVAKLPATVGRRQGKIGKYFGFAERRSDPYPTMVHAVADGLIPRTLDASAAFNIHADNFARARATHLLEGQLAVSGLGKWGVAKNAPEGWVPLAGHSEEFSKLVPFMRAGGSEEAAQAVAAAKLAGQVPMGAGNPEDVPDVAVHKLFVPPFVEKALSPVTAPDYLAREVPGFARMRTAQRGLKQAILGLSGFHLLTENAMAKADVGVRGMLRAFRADRTSPWFIEQERDLVGSGGTSAVQGNTIDAYRGLRPGTIPTRAEVIRAYIPGSKQALELADTITRFTFENVQRRFKVVSFALHRDAWTRDNPTATPDQASEAKRGIASYVNGVYGGLHWENMGWSRAMVEVGRAALLAPDWSGSNVALAKYAFDAPLSRAEFGRHPLEGATTKESAQARLARAFWAKQLVQGLTENQMLSLMFSGRLSPRPFQVYLGRDDDGNEVYQNVVFRGSTGDAVSLGTKLEEHGLLGAGLFVGSKAAPFAKLGMHLVTGRNDFGQQIAPAGRGLVRNTLHTGAAVAADVSPVPLVLRGIQKDTLGDDSDKYLWSERILSLFGPLGQHVDPDRGWRNRE